MLLAGCAHAQTWIPLKPTGSPPTGHDVYAAYDSVNNRLIAYLPGNSSAPGAQVWILANANGLGGTPGWAQLHPGGTPPSATTFVTAVYDPYTDQLIVYGGCGGSCSPALPNVLILSHANGLGGAPVWSQSITNPSEPRDHQSAVYDPLSKTMIAFGGSLAFFGTDQNDTRLLSNANASSATWTALYPLNGPPSVREGHSAVYDQSHNVMTIFGGGDAISTCCPYDIVNYNDVWKLSNANGRGSSPPTWTKITPTGVPPPPRQDHSGVYDATYNRMLVFGGANWSNATQSWTILGDLWQLTNANGLGATPPAWQQIGQLGTPPGAKSNHAVGFDSVHERMIVVGGSDGDTEAQVLVFVLALNQK
jgi:hypothetical protein